MKSQRRDRVALTRRAFIADTAAGIAAAKLAWAADQAATAPTVRPGAGDPEDGVREYLTAATLRKEWVDRFLDPKAQVWARFDPELGYLLRNSVMRDGVDGACTLSRYEPTGQRKQLNFPDQPCRINTYGDSFTQCHQVSDGETWQEVLAAHFCEPIRNFGIGGYGVYQAWRRLLRTEATEMAAPYIIFNIWGDDHTRSITASRWPTLSHHSRQKMAINMFHANPWCHARLDFRTGELIERPSPGSDPQFLYKLCDAEFVYHAFKDDEVVRLLVATRTEAPVDLDNLERIAAGVGFRDLNLNGRDNIRRSAERVHRIYGWRVSMKIMEKLRRYAAEHDRKLMVLLSYPSSSVLQACQGGSRDDWAVNWHSREFREFLAAQKILFVDTLDKHLADFQTFRGTAKEYVDRYYIGHYNPSGNQFFARAIKDELVTWLDPKPPAYRSGDEPLIRFKGYLPG